MQVTHLDQCKSQSMILLELNCDKLCPYFCSFSAGSGGGGDMASFGGLAKQDQSQQQPSGFGNTGGASFSQWR